MKTKILIIVALLSAFYSLAQTDGWFLYTKPNTISAIVPDDTNTDILHLATDIGYIQFNTNTGLVTDFLNLTSQNPAIGHVNGLDVNPTNANIALALDDGIAIYNGTTVTIYNYDNSNLTVGSVGGSQFTKLEVRYGRQGELYIFKPDVTGYQVFNTGVFDTEVVTTFKPQDITENLAGTKVYFAGSNDGLHELTKATTTWTNYTTSNSDLIYNPLESLHVDSNDLLYIGGFQGLNTMTNAGAWNTYQQLEPVNNIFFLPVYDISLNESNGDLLIQTSIPNSSNFGLSTLDLATNTWTNFTNDNTNCLNTNNFRASTFGGDGNIYTSKGYFPGNGSLFKFNHNTNSCSEPNINYLNCPTPANSNLISSFTVRKKANGNLDIGFTRGENLHIVEIDPDTFNGTFGAATTITPSLGKSAYSVLSDNDYFIVENNTGWTFIDGNNATTEFTHNLPSYLAIVTKKTAAYYSDNGIINLVHKGFDATFNYRVYKTQCNTATGICSEPEEMFTTNRDFTQNIGFGTTQDPATNMVSVMAIKTGNTNSRKTSKSLGGNRFISVESFNGDINDSPFQVMDEPFNGPSDSDPIFLNIPENIPGQFWVFYGAFISGVDIKITITDTETGVITEHSSQNEIKGDCVFEDTDIYDAPIIITENENKLEANGLDLSIDPEGFQTLYDNPIPGADFGSDSEPLPNDLFLRSTRFIPNEPISGNRQAKKKQNQNEATMVMLTNYGMLIKTGIDISNLVLSTKDVSVSDKSLLLYPNPANDMVSFSDNSIKTIAVYDINGRKVLSTTNSNSFSVKTLAQGIYIVKATNTDNSIITKKLIVD